MDHLPEPYRQLVDAFNQRHWAHALEVASVILPKAPDDPGVHYIAGIANVELKRVPYAIAHLKKALTLAPKRADYAVQLAKVFALANLNRDAKAAADHALALNPADALTLDTLGVVFSQIGDYDSAVTAFRKVVSSAPNHAPYRYNLGTSLVASGRLDEAEAEIEACISLDPRFWRAHLTLAQLKRQTPESNHVERLTTLLDSLDTRSPESTVRTCLNLALFKEHEDLADYPRAMKYLVAGKSAGRTQRNYSPAQDGEMFQAIMDSFHTRPAVASQGCPTTEPIFVVGMPRTGTTLVERIISSHPDVQSAGELLNFPLAVKQASAVDTPDLIDLKTIAGVRQPDWQSLGEAYLSATRPLTGGKAHFVDKLPHNFLYLGWIAHALPNAKIVCLRRNPMDTCLSNFRQLFAPKAPYFDYSYDLLDTGRYYVLFDRLMAYWRKLFPGRILQVDYESLVESQEPSTRQIIDFCQLPWHENCLRFDKNPSPVATASAVQVRSPIYRSSMRRWKKYETELKPLRDLLEQSGIAVE
jgi:tetratricopeptide (TPR) repeat protein